MASIPAVSLAQVHENNSKSGPPSKQKSPTVPAKRKRKVENTNHVLHQSTFKKPSWSYFHLSLIMPSIPNYKSPVEAESPSIDPITILSLLQSPLSSFLGTHGASITIDILKIVSRDVWIRVPRQDASAIEAALSNWVGWTAGDVVPGAGEGAGRLQVAWRVVGMTECLGRLGDGGEAVVGDGRDLFGE